MIKFRQKIYSEEEKEGGVLAPLLIAGGIGSAAYGKSRINKASKTMDKIPEMIKDVKRTQQKGKEEVDAIKKSWGGTGKFFRKKKIRRVEEESRKSTEQKIRQARKAIRSVTWNRRLGKAAIGLGALTAGYGAHRMYKDRKKYKKSIEDQMNNG